MNHTRVLFETGSEKMFTLNPTSTREQFESDDGTIGSGAVASILELKKRGLAED